MTLWGGRFNSGIDDAVFNLSRSIHFDWRLAQYDLRSSLAHIEVLEQNQIISSDVALQLRNAIKQLQKEVKDGSFLPLPQDEDVHSALERGLKEKIGDVGGAIRAGRSRNDQVATDFRLYLIDHMIELSTLLIKLEKAIIELAQNYVEDIAPGFTHLQHAQPISFAQEIAKHAHAFARDISRIRDWLTRSSFSPLGSGALAGSSLPLTPEHSAKNLGFTGVIPNSIDAVSDRDFAAEALFIMATIGIHLSRIGEEWCLLSSTEFGWAEIDDAFATGSSIMPQKKNPDVAELARGKAGRFIGNLTGLLTVLKGMPFAYNRDLQEDKEFVFDSVENLLLLIPPVTGMIASTEFNRAKMRAAAPLGFSLATEIADFLVKQGVPFSQAHEAAGSCVKMCEVRGIALHELSDQELLTAHPKLSPAVRQAVELDGAVNGRTASNSASPSQVKIQLSNLEDSLKKDLAWSSNERQRFSGMMAQ
ncbi:MAG: argininosuccinate lyase [Candidatus Nanopelagicaceae bacterium]|nr:argininosuccinate lyase [Candidatus Nanopelagicaceae bacterium]